PAAFVRCNSFFSKTLFLHNDPTAHVWPLVRDQRLNGTPRMLPWLKGVLVPKLCLGTPLLETLFRDYCARSGNRVSRKGFPNRVWEAGVNSVSRLTRPLGKQSFQQPGSQTECGNQGQTCGYRVGSDRPYRTTRWYKANTCGSVWASVYFSSINACPAA